MYLFSGRGLRLEPLKKPSMAQEIQTPALCDAAMVPLYTLGESHLEPMVNIGGSVAKNAILAVSKSKSHAITAPVSGTLLGVETVVHPFLGRVPCAMIQVDSKKKPLAMKHGDPERLTAESLIGLAKAAGIIDEYDGVPLYRKLRLLGERGVSLLVADAIDDEPYVSSGMAVLAECAAEAADGLRFAAQAVGAEQKKIAVFDPGGIKPLKQLKDSVEEIELLRVNGKYPIWAELEKKLGKSGTVGKIGIQACVAFSRAVRLGEPQTDIVITVAGDCVGTWQNVRVPVGTPVQYILSQCGLAREPVWVVLGDSMHGVTITDTDTPVIQGVRAILAFAERTWVKHYACIGCGRCMEVCPVKLMPYYIQKLSERGEYAEAIRYGADRCIGCGACSAVCPSGIELSATMEAVLSGKPAIVYDWSDLG